MRNRRGLFIPLTPVFVLVLAATFERFAARTARSEQSHAAAAAVSAVLII
jgi:hypothetical protein